VPLVTVPANADPADTGTAHSAITLCDLWPGVDIPPAAWVQVVIRSPAEAGPTPDAFGHVLHCLWRFARPSADFGKRRTILGNSAPRGLTGNEPIEVQSDDGTFWIGTEASLRFMGGVAGEVYDVSVTYVCPRDEQDPAAAIDVYEDPFRFELSSIFVVGANVPMVALPPAPLYHREFYVVQGAAQVIVPGGSGGIVPLDASYGLAGAISLSLGRIEVSTGIYKTRGTL
jgi:hypothetical protein